MALKMTEQVLNRTGQDPSGGARYFHDKSCLRVVQERGYDPVARYEAGRYGLYFYKEWYGGCE